jgi:hypothetical protein
VNESPQIVTEMSFQQRSSRAGKPDIAEKLVYIPLSATRISSSGSAQALRRKKILASGAVA